MKLDATLMQHLRQYEINTGGRSLGQDMTTLQLSWQQMFASVPACNSVAGMRGFAAGMSPLLMCSRSGGSAIRGRTHGCRTHGAVP